MVEKPHQIVRKYIRRFHWQAISQESRCQGYGQTSWFLICRNQ